MILRSINPATGETIYEYPELQWEEVDRSLNEAVRKQSDWQQWSSSERAALFLRLAGLLRERSEGLSFLITAEMGKVIAESRAEIEKCAWLCEYYAQNGPAFLSSEFIDAYPGKGQVVYNPLGLILAIMPWNFPFWQVLRCAVPALLAGNGVILKHAGNVNGCAVAIEELFVDSGFPVGLFRTLLLSSKKVQPLIADKRIRAISLTGSSTTGKEVAAVAGAHLKKVVMELGGSDPYLVLADADLNVAVDACVRGRLLNAGQSCIAAKRFIVESAVYDEFESLFVSRMNAVLYGDPFDAANQIGPMARNNLREELQRQVNRSVSKGAQIVCGGFIPEGPGAFYPPTVLSGVVAGMPAYSEELFGPVAALIRVATAEEAVQVANDTVFGLGAAIFTRRLDYAQHLAENRLECGCVFINEPVRSDPRLPFGGIRESGWGRELSRFGLLEFVNIKTIYRR